jgi:hypothetical protein
MSDDVVNDAEKSPDEKTVLLERAKDLNLRVSPNIGLDTLRKKVNAALQGGDPDADNEEDAKSSASGKNTTEILRFEDYETAELKALPEGIRTSIIREYQNRTQMKLVRCQIFNLDPSKTDMQGEIYTVRNKYLGSIKRMVPWGDKVANGWHLPVIMVNYLRGRKFVQKKSIRDPKTGRIDLKTELVPEFNIVELPPLTEKELKELKENQGAAARVGFE